MNSFHLLKRHKSAWQESKTPAMPMLCKADITLFRKIEGDGHFLHLFQRHAVRFITHASGRDVNLS